MRLDALLDARPRRAPSPPPAQPELPPHAPPGVLALPHPDWLRHEPTATGDADALRSFRTAAAGAGVVPWVHDRDQLEEHWLALMLAQPGRTISLAGAKIVAREARDAMREEHDEATAWVGRSRAVPLDLRSLVPVPREVLRQGPDAPASMRRLWENWGTTWPLRKVERLSCPAHACRVGFWSADWTPWPVLAMCGARWPALAFRLRVVCAADRGPRPSGDIRMDETIAAPRIEDGTKPARPKLHKVLLLNDDYTPRGFVVRVLKAEFGMGEGRAYGVMMTAHRLGSCVVAVFTREVAEEKATRATDMARKEGHPLTFATEPEE